MTTVLCGPGEKKESERWPTMQSSLTALPRSAHPLTYVCVLSEVEPSDCDKKNWKRSARIVVLVHSVFAYGPSVSLTTLHLLHNSMGLMP